MTNIRQYDRYDLLLKDTREHVLDGVHDYHYVDENGLGGTHIGKWRGIKKATVLWMYEQGRGVPVSLAVQYGAKGKHHAKRLDACVNAVELLAVGKELSAAGISMEDIERSRKLMGSRVGKSKSSSTISNPAQTKGDSVVVVKQGQAHTYTAPSKPITLHEMKVREAMLLAEKMELLKAQIDKAKKANARLNKVGTMSDEEKAALLERHTNKGKAPVIK